MKQRGPSDQQCYTGGHNTTRRAECMLELPQHCFKTPNTSSYVVCCSSSSICYTYMVNASQRQHISAQLQNMICMSYRNTHTLKALQTIQLIYQQQFQQYSCCCCFLLQGSITADCEATVILGQQAILQQLQSVQCQQGLQVGGAISSTCQPGGDFVVTRCKFAAACAVFQSM